MADGKQQPQSNEIANPTAAAQATKREGLLAKAKSRIEKIDVGGDNLHDQQEAEAKRKALEFVSNECLTLPEDRFFKLLDAIEVRMKQKEAYRENLLEEFRKARKEVAESVKRNKGAEAISYIADRSETLFDEAIFKTGFDPSKLNAETGAKELIKAESKPNFEKNAYSEIMESDKRIAWFVAYWNADHPVRWKLFSRWRADIVNVLDRINERIRKELKFPGTISSNVISDPKALYDLSYNHVTSHNSKRKYDTTANRLLDRVAEYDPTGKFARSKIVDHSFAQSVDGLDANTYVRRSCNYLQYSFSTPEAEANFRKEIFGDASKRKATGLVINWTADHPVRIALENLGDKKTLAHIDGIRSQLMRESGLNEYSLRQRTTGEVTKAIATGKMEMSASEKLSVTRIVGTGFEKGGKLSAELSEFVGRAAADGWKIWEALMKELDSNPDALKKFISNWPNTALANGIRGTQWEAKTNAMLSAKKAEVVKLVGKGGSVDALIDSNKEKRTKELYEKAKRFEQYKKEIFEHSEMMFEGVMDRNGSLVESHKLALLQLSEWSLLNISKEARALGGGRGELRAIEEKFNGLRIAIEALRDMNIGNEEVSVKSFVKSIAARQLNEGYVSAKRQQVTQILKWNYGALMTFKSEVGGLVRTYGWTDEASVDKAVRTGVKLDPSKLNPEAFVGSIVKEYTCGNLSLATLERRWWADRVKEFAIYWDGKWLEDGDESAVFLRAINHRFLDNNRWYIREELQKVLGQSLAKEGAKTVYSVDIANGQKIAKSVDDFVKAFPTANRSAVTEALMKISQNRYSTQESVRLLAKLIKKEALNGKEIRTILDFFEKQNESEIKTTKTEVDANPYGKKEYLIRDLPIVREDLIKLKLNKKEAELLKSEKKISALDKEDLQTFKGILVRLPDFQNTNCWAYLTGKAKLESLYEKRAEIAIVKANATDALGKDMHDADNATDPKKREAAKKKLQVRETAVAESVKKVRSDAHRQESLRKEADALKNDLSGTSLENADLATLFANAKNASSAMRELEAAGKTDTKIYRLLKEKTETDKRVAEAMSAATKVLGSPLVISSEVFADVDPKEAKRMREEFYKDVGIEKSKIPADPTDGTKGLSRNGETVTNVSEFAKNIPNMERGASAKLSDDVTAVKNSSGGIDIVTEGKTLRFDLKDAEGALQMAELFDKSGMGPLIPAMKEIAKSSGVQLKDGVSRAEAGAILSTMASVLGFDTFANEPDPLTLAKKLKTGASGALGNGNLEERMRNLGFLDKDGKTKAESVAAALDGKTNGELMKSMA